MNTNIHLRELPEVPPEILRAALEGNLVIFVGAGASRLAGGPSWNELSYRALEQLAEKKKITFSGLDQLSRLDARTQLTIASQIEKAEKFNIDYKSLLEPKNNCNYSAKKNNSEIYDFLDKIGCVFVTTNYDNLLDPQPQLSEVESVDPDRIGRDKPPDRIGRDKLICRADQFLIGVLRAPGAVVHLHGSVEDRGSMIISTSDYIQHYEKPLVKKFLLELFEKYTVLFVGYSLGENEILEQMLRKGETGDQAERKRFLLQGYFSHQHDLFRYMYGYFRGCFGVHLCGFTLDICGFRQLELIIKDWSSRIEVRPPALADDLDFVLEAALSNLSHRQIDALNRIERLPELQSFFFKEAKGLKWFDEFQKRGFFSPAMNPMPEESKEKGYWQVPTWPVLEYLVATAPELEEVCNDEYVEKYLYVIRSVTWQAMEVDDGNYRTWWLFAKIVRYIPLQCIALDDIELFAYWLSDRFNGTLVGVELNKGILKKLFRENNSHSNSLLLELIKVFTRINWVKGRNALRGETEPKLIIDDYYAKKIFKNTASDIGRVLGKDGVEVFRDRVTEILAKDDKDGYANIWRPAIEDHPQNRGTKESLNIMISAFRDSINGFVLSHPADAVEYILFLFENEYKTIRRVALHSVSQSLKVLQNATSLFLTPEYFCYHYQHELFHFLKKNFSILTPEFKTKVLNIINGLTVDTEAEGELRTKQLAYKKLIWLSAIKGQEDEYADKLYQENLRIAGKEPDHPDFSSYMGAGWVGDKTPYQKEELLSRKIDDLIELLNAFEEDKTGWNRPTMRGLANEFKQAIKTRPKDFEENLDKFIPVDFAFSFEVIAAFRDLWTEKKYEVDWHKLFDFCLKLIQREDFWSEKLNTHREEFVANRSWIVGSIGELIEAGTRNDEHAFDTRYLPEAKTLLDLLLDKQEGEEFKAEGDAVSVAINSPRGKCVEALVNYALRSARVADKVHGSHEEAWAELQADFERELARSNEGIYEFCTLVANYLPNFLYLSQDWTITSLPLIFPKENRLHWLCAMRGYAYVNKVYKEFYDFMKVEGHFLSALDANELKENTKEKVIQNIIIGYISWDEKLDDPQSLIRALLDRDILEETKQVIWFLSGFKKHSEPKLKKKIFDLWRYFDNKIDIETEEGRKFFSELCTWSRFVTDLSGEEKELLRRAVPFAEMAYHSYIVIEVLKDLVDRFPEETGEIYLAMLEGCYPTYEQGHIEYIIKQLFLNEGSKAMAQEIVDKYIKYGVSFPHEYLKQL